MASTASKQVEFDASVKIKVEDIPIPMDDDNDKKSRKMDPGKEKFVMAYIAGLPAAEQVAPVENTNALTSTTVVGAGVGDGEFSQVESTSMSMSVSISTAAAAVTSPRSSVHDSKSTSEAELEGIPWPDIKTHLRNHFCPPYDDPNPQCPPEKKCVNKEGKPICPTLPQRKKPPFGISDAYWKLRGEKYCRPPSKRKFRKAKFAVDENKQDPQLYVPFPLFESESNLSLPKYEFTPKKTPHRGMSEFTRRMQIQKMASNMRTELEEINRDFNHFGSLPWNHLEVPKNRIDWGCERLRKLAVLAPHAVNMILQRFITGPTTGNLYWLGRTEAMECWERMLTVNKKIKKCCVQQDSYYYERKAKIPSLSGPDRKSTAKHRETEVREEMDAKIAATLPEELPGLLEDSGHVPRVQKPKNIPPFCNPLPPKEQRMPWHIEPIVPRNEPEFRKIVKIDRNMDLDDIIPITKDPYGEDRNKQRFVRNVEIRERMVEDFLFRTSMDPGEFSDQAVNFLTSDRNFKLNMKSKSDIKLAQLLAASEYSNTAGGMRREENNTEKDRRRNKRGHVEDFSYVKSRYMDINSRGKQITRRKQYNVEF